MRLLDRYVLRQVGLAFLLCLIVLTLLIWLIAALRDFNLVTAQGQSLLVFAIVSSLALPSLVAIIAPVALFTAVAWGLNRFNSDSELVVMNAGGLSPARLSVPFILLAFLVAGLTGMLSIVGQPASQHELRTWLAKVGFDVISKIVREGQFTTIAGGTITFHVREKRPNGALLGILVQDARGTGQILTYIAERGELVEMKAKPAGDGQPSADAQPASDPKPAGDAQPSADVKPASDAKPGGSDKTANGAGLFLVLEKGSILRESRNGGEDSSVVVFEHYAFDLSQLVDEPDITYFKPRERYTSELWNYLWTYDPNDPASAIEAGRVRSELVERFVSPLYPVAFMFVALAALGQARTTRQSRSSAVGIAIAAIGVVRIFGFFTTQTLAVRSTAGAVMGFVVPLATTAICLLIIFGVLRPRVPRALTALSGRLAMLFTRPQPAGGAQRP